jgi:PhnB protein
MNVEPYLFFNGRCEEAIEFYQRAIGAEVVMKMRFSDSPEPCDPKMVPPGTEHKIMHGHLRVGAASILVSDGNCGSPAKFEGMALSLTVSNPDAAAKAFAALGDGGKVNMPLTKTFFSPSFGMLADRFGVPWMVYVAQGAA